MSGAVNKDFYIPNYFFSAICELVEEKPQLLDDLKIIFAGAIKDDLEYFFELPIISKIVEKVGYVEHRISIKYLINSDILLFFMNTKPGSNRILTGKIFEYLAARKPIIALVSDGEITRLIKEANAGVIVEPEDISAIKSSILSMYSSYKDGSLVFNGDDNMINGYERKKLTMQLAQVFDEIVH